MVQADSKDRGVCSVRTAISPGVLGRWSGAHPVNVERKFSDAADVHGYTSVNREMIG